MSGIEGRMYRPLAAAVVATLAASLVLALTIVPVVASRILRRKPAGHEEDTALIRARQTRVQTAARLESCARRHRAGRRRA